MWHLDPLTILDLSNDSRDNGTVTVSNAYESPPNSALLPVERVSCNRACETRGTEGRIVRSEAERRDRPASASRNR